MAGVVKQGFKHAPPMNRQDIETLKYRVDSVLHPRRTTRGWIPPHHPLLPLDMSTRGNPSHHRVPLISSVQGRVPGVMTGHAACAMARRLFDPLAGHLNRRKIITVVAWWVFAVLLVGYLRRIWAQRRRGGGEVVRGGGDARELGEGEDGGDYTSLCSLPCFALFLMLVRTVSVLQCHMSRARIFPR